MITIKMTLEEFNMLVVALQNTANACEQTAKVFKQWAWAAWRATETREMAAKYDQMVDGFRKQAREEGW